MKFIRTIVPACLLAFAGCEPGGEPNDDRTVTAGEYTVTAPELVIHASVDGEPLGRLYRGEVMDIHRVQADGWAHGFAGGTVQRCVWAKFRDVVPTATVINFNEDEPGPHNGGCESAEADDAPDPSEWASRISADGDEGTPILTDCDRSAYWKNWDWDAGTGVGTEDGILDRDTEVHWRYVTRDGNGVMARIDDDNWVFIARPCMPL